ncbi:Concanavalin A-like lectin/glucanase, subgroup [Artemisia annua]|uniref:Concanavalin A-like lectin/glucanase, subgroup n=1 Tax=Artemisia annua TaxID=35608 RepID=A0A2U1MI98_ARTAN|nr:Concanavalin A-like lectin/glucanase, subgroup [Artemisia annua]
MEQFHALWLFILILLKTASIEANSLNGCQDMCGYVTIPYPFGIGANCSINKWYNIDCNSSIPYLSALNNLEVMRVSVEDQTVIPRVSMFTSCKKRVQYSSEIMSIDLNGSPFLFNKFQNILVVKGCGNAVLLDRKKVVTGCSTTCHNDTVNEKNNCFGISCCQSTFPYHLKSYILDFTGFENQSHDGTCKSSFIVDKQAYVLGSTMLGLQSLVPVSLLWTLTKNDMKKINCNGRNGNVTFDLGNGKSVMSGNCTCKNKFHGNPYLPRGCKEADVCKSCERKRSLCSFRRTYALDGLYDTGWQAHCSTSYNNFDSGSRKSSPAILLELVSFLYKEAVVPAKE